MRKNGLDVQIIDGVPDEEQRPNSVLSISRSDGPFIGQPFHGSRDNILERTARFAEAFLRNADDLEAMVQPIQSEKALPKPPPKARVQDDDLYSAFGGERGTNSFVRWRVVDLGRRRTRLGSLVGALGKALIERI